MNNGVAFTFLSHKVLRWLGPFFIIMAIAMIVVWILMIVASYKIMGGSDGHGVLHAVGTLFFGTFWVCITWMWAGLSGRKICKLHK